MLKELNEAHVARGLKQTAGSSTEKGMVIWVIILKIMDYALY